MTKKIKILILSLFAFVLLTLFNTADANSINSISMDIFLDDEGNASVTEVWECYATEWTEVYHPYYNLGNSKITDLIVSDSKGEYTTLSYWDTSGDLEDKAYKCGINKISDGVELCWGISEYGYHTYTAKYKISNFVSELTDSQMIYWTLIPHNFSDSIGNAYIKIYSNFNIDDSVGVWGYGNYGGTAYVYDGYIEMQSDGSLSKSEYMTILVQFPLETFKCNNKLGNDFEHYYNMAEDGATHYTYEDDSFETIITRIAVVVMFICFWGFIFSVIGYIIFSNLKHYDFGPEGKKITKDAPYFRDIPCNKDLYRAYFVANEYNILKNKNDIAGAIILKWIKDGIISVRQETKGKILKKEEAVITIINENPEIANKNEQKLFDLLCKQSILEVDGNKTVDNEKLKKWCEDHYERVFSWFDSVLKEEKDKLVEDGLLIKKKATFLKIFKYDIYEISQELREDAVQIAGLKRFLLDYTLIKEREAIEVHLFEEYLIFAQMLGIAKKVAKQFSELYPDLVEQSCFNSYDNFYFVNVYAYSAVHEASVAKSRAESYSSGGGGFSSGGGGGGSFGGGSSGGGGFR